MRTITWGAVVAAMLMASPAWAHSRSYGRYYSGPPKRAILYPDWNGSARDGWVPYIRQRSIDQAGNTIIPGGRIFELKWRRER
jgi:hypothetical protein